MTLATKGLAWSALADDQPATRDGGDPLGFRSFANRLAREIAPGLTLSTNQARAFGVLCLGLRDFAEADDGGGAFLKFETFWVSAQARHFQNEPELNRWRGKRSALWRVQAAGPNGEVSLTQPILQNQLSAGTWGAYRRSGGLFGLTRRATQRGRPEKALLTPQGSLLADATWQAIRSAAGKKVHFAYRIKQGAVPADGLKWVLKDGKPSKAELAILNRGIQGFDRASDGRLGALYRVWSETGELSISSLVKGDGLPQADSVAAGAAVVHLISALEPPLRKWAATGSEPNLPSGVWQSKAWDQVGAWGEHDLLALRNAGLEAGSGLAALQQHQRWLAEIRGSEPWEAGMAEPSVRRFTPPVFALPAVQRLFEDGVNPCG